MTRFHESQAWRVFDLGHPGGGETTRSLIKRSGLQKGARVLDLCCGAGDSLIILQDYKMEVWGVDRKKVLDHALTKYEKLNNDSLYSWEGGERLPFANHFFDAVLCECSYSLLEDKEQVLKEVRRVLKEQGLFLIQDMTKDQPFKLKGFDLDDWQDESDFLKPFITRWIWMTGTKYPKTCEGDRYFSGVYKKIKKGVDHGF